MTVAALILADANAVESGAPSPALTRLIEAAWSGGAQPILVSGLSGDHDLAPLAQRTSAVELREAAGEALKLVGGTTALLTLPISHAGVDPETITALIAAHGRTPERALAAARDGTSGPIHLTPVALAISGGAHAPLLIECGDEAAVTPSDGRTRLAYDAPPADTDAIDPWEQRGEESR